jgi:midasin (ATPase involved in ribosome maturation)
MDANKEESILSVTSVTFEEEMVSGNKRRKVVRKPFLSQNDCPFPFYAVIQEPSQLPTTLADILRQWIEMSSK